MDVPKFNEREKALENDYIRRKESVVPDSCLWHSPQLWAEKFKPAAPTQPGNTQASNPGQNAQPKK
ncbi:hypothetical protein G647_04758 [Cladophialophora carrionii CBS 160.54]|uniref:Uncharacterized protein n=1 Tax=Cladophialophora carrionii CBS 160.54 TaxID=1279043 RepID=V9D9J3_9EURO|nr:uncharacterized protein G647_04758 [Cladophialophora carrionii CBS 160.54]ETI22963.1 hypothetical protein G647_04758 [Cladophialophora carrionii CBS 160.54]